MFDPVRVLRILALGACLLAPVSGQNSPPPTALEDLLDLQISTAALHEQSSREAPASVTVITAADIERRGYHTLAEILQDTRSFYLTNDRNYTYAGVRGFSRPGDYNNRLLILLNGAPLNEAIWGSVAVGSDLGINLQAVERIEIVRGPGSALYGTNAMFAVINIMTKTGQQQDGLSVGAGVGNDGAREGRAVWGRAFDNGLDLALTGEWEDVDGADLYYAEFDDPETNDGVAVGRDWDRSYGITGRASYGRFQFQGHAASRETGIPTGSYETDFNGATRSLDEFETLEARYHRDLSAADHLMLRAAYFHYHYKGMWPYDGEPFYDESHNNSAYGEIRYRRDLRPTNRLIIGAGVQKHYNAEYRDWDAEGTYFDGDLPFSVLSVYAQDEQQLTARLALTLGLRVDRYSHVGTAVTPRAALVYHPGQYHTFKLLYGEAFRAPGMYELEYSDQFSGVAANPDLQPERIRTMEIVWEQQFLQRAQSVVSVYRHRMRRLIDQVYDEIDDTIQHRNISRVAAYGVEVGLEGTLPRGLTGYSSYSYQRAEDAATDTRLSNYPSHLFKGGLFVPLFGPVEAHGRLQYESSRRTEHDSATDGYLRTDIGLRLLTSRAGRHQIFSVPLTASLTVSNLFDVEYAVPGGLDLLQATVPQDGRRFWLRLELGD